MNYPFLCLATELPEQLILLLLYISEKILPRLRKRSTAVANPAMLDYVFRLVRTSGVEPAPEDIEDPLAPTSHSPPIHDNW